MMKKAGMVVGAVIAAVIVLMAFRAASLGGSKSDAEAMADFPAYNAQQMAARLGEAIRFETISEDGDWAPDEAAFSGFAEFLEQTYPAAHKAMSRERVGGHSLMYKWPGRNGGKPIGFLAHIDVVPVEQGTENEWTRPPFSGEIFDGKVWGRGALDNKSQIISMMEAAERLAQDGFRPERDIYFLFGHDEEVGGNAGAGAMAALLGERGVELAWTMDEGSGLASGIVPGVEKPVALISTAEKGSVTLRLTARGQGGHSSTPAPDTAVSILSRAIVAVNDNPFPSKIDKNITAFMHALASEMSFLRRFVLGNLWLTGPLVKQQLSGDPLTAASLHTTTAPTVIEGGQKANILPQQASALVNYRIHPRDNVEKVRARAEKLINDDRVTIEVLSGREPTPQASTNSEGYQAIAGMTEVVFGGVPIAPSLTLQGTDSRHYTEVADDNYRFTPFIYTPDDLQRMHGTDERIAIENLPRAAFWYESFIRATVGAE